MLFDAADALEKSALIKENFINKFEKDIANRMFPYVAKFVRDELIKNMTDYNYAGVEPRSDDLKMIFDVLEDLFGFEYNPNGSFTKDGALDALDLEYEQTDSPGRKFSYITFRSRDRLARLENGETDWGGLKKLFSKEKIKIILIGKYGIGGYLQVKRAADKLFGKSSVPERPYLKSAWEKGEFYMHSEIVSNIEEIEGVKRV